MNVGNLNIKETKEGWVSLIAIHRALSSIGIKCEWATLLRFSQGKLPSNAKRQKMKFSRVELQKEGVTTNEMRTVYNKEAVITILSTMAGRERWDKERTGISPVRYSPREFHSPSWRIRIKNFDSKLT